MIHVLLPLARPPHELVGLFHKEPAQPRELYSYLSVGSQLALSWLYSWLSVGSRFFTSNRRLGETGTAFNNEIYLNIFM